MPAQDGVLRDLTRDDFTAAHRLYKDLVGAIDVPDGSIGAARFAEIIAHPGTVIRALDRDGALVSMATLHVLPNMTFDARPYALIENVVTRRAAQGQGYGRMVLQSVIDTAWQAGAYKIMLLTGQRTTARRFYERLGFTSNEKWGMTLRRAPLRDTG